MQKNKKSGRGPTLFHTTVYCIYLFYFSRNKKYVFMNLSVSVHKYSLFFAGKYFIWEYVHPSIYIIYLFDCLLNEKK